MTLGEVRSKYVEFFKARGHQEIPSASLIPENDPTTLFTGSGMQPLLPYLLGKDHPVGKRLVNSQKCFRAQDIEEVGNNRHTTFFEMLGNWSLGDYFKKEQLPWFFEFLTDAVGLDPQRLYVTCYIGDEKNHIPKDTESADIWKELFKKKGIDAKTANIGSEEEGYKRGMKEGERIFFYGNKNWWTRSGTPEKMPAGEPGGPDSEVFYEFTQIKHDPAFGAECHPNCDCGRFLEIGNSVFMQYVKKEDGSFGLLPKQNVDFGGGLERIAAASINDPDVFKSSHARLLKFIEDVTKTTYHNNPKPYRVIADHAKAAIFLIVDGVLPGNKDQGYFVRRLIRRSVVAMSKLRPSTGIDGLVHLVVEDYQDQYPELKDKEKEIIDQIDLEQTKFGPTIQRGIKELERLSRGGAISARDAFLLVTTYGFPLELIVELVPAGTSIDIIGFGEEMKRHQELSRAGSEQKFKGGLADTSEKTTRLHTAHHLLLAALQQVLGKQVKQRGSNITQERLRIDFSHGEKMTKEQLLEVEQIVNEKIKEDLLVIRTEMSKDEAEKLGAEHEFGAKYPERVSVYSVGPVGEAFSLEFCGGPHVERTGQLASSRDPEALSKGPFRILKEEAVAQGIRRIKATLQ